MNDKSAIRKIKIMLMLIVLTIAACGFLPAQERQYPQLGSFQETGDYLINPETILAALDKGEPNIFMPLPATPVPDSRLAPGSVPWTQSEYLRIAKALSQQVWKETMEDWNVYYIDFQRECQDNPHGFDSFVAIYYKPIEINSEKVYTARQLAIYPLFHQVNWGGGENFPRPFLGNWKNIDLNKSKITADNALQIAEENGGKEARSRVGNNCHILVSAPNDVKGNWDVYYSSGVYFEMLIDPYTGKYKILPNK